MRTLLLTVGAIALAGIADAQSPEDAAIDRGVTTQVYYRSTTIDDVEIFYREAGSRENPTVLLLHGFPTSSHMFRNLIPALAEGYHVVAPDNPGFRFSSMPAVDELPYTFDRLADMGESFVYQLGLASYII